MRELQFADLDLFAQVAELGTLSAVAREHDVPVSQVSRTPARIAVQGERAVFHAEGHWRSKDTYMTATRHRRPKIGACLDDWAGWFGQARAKQERAA